MHFVIFVIFILWHFFLSLVLLNVKLEMFFCCVNSMDMNQLLNAYRGYK
jgi:hypothetical protein